MTRPLVDRIADAVLYEGYLLYPYRPSVKNRQRWTFGGLYPEPFCQANASGDASESQTECLVEGDSDTVLEATVRFLHLTDRRVGEFVPPLAEWPRGSEPEYRLTETLRVGDRVYYPWQEAQERAVSLGSLRLADLPNQSECRNFTFPGRPGWNRFRARLGKLSASWYGSSRRFGGLSRCPPPGWPRGCTA